MNSLAWSAIAAAVLVPAVVSVGSERHEAAHVIDEQATGDVGEVTGEVTLRGEVVEVDWATGRLALTTEAGRLVFHVPPRDLAGVCLGDVLEVVLLNPPDHEREEAVAAEGRALPSRSF
jgi:hypothetical protein